MTGKPLAGTPIMNRQQREDELRTMLTTQRGKEELLEILKKHAGIEGGNLPPFGTLLVDTILNYEFPPESDQKPLSQPEATPATVAAEKIEPGDVKFAAPPGQEAPGG
jgi:hypothetical protein